MMKYFLPSFSSFHELKEGCASNMQRYVHEILPNLLAKLDQGKCD